MKSHPSPLIYCKKVGKCGRGVFARTSIKKGAVIEACPIIVISKKDYKEIFDFEQLNQKPKVTVKEAISELYDLDKKPKEKLIAKPQNKYLKTTSSYGL